MAKKSHAWRALGLDLVSLRVLLATAEEGSLAKAGARENIAVSAVSRRISELEARTGVQMFDRHDRGVSLTPAGENLAAQLHHVFELLDRIALDLEAIRGGLRGHVRLHAHMSAASGLLPRIISEFLQKHPGIGVEVDEFTSLEVIHAVKTGVADVGLVSGTVKAEGLEVFPWQHDSLVAVLPKGHQLADKDSLLFADLISEPFIGMQKNSALLALYREQARALGQQLQERAHAASFESARIMVSVGLGVSILPAGAAYPFVDSLGLDVRPLTESWAQRPLMLCIRNTSLLSAASKLFINYMMEHATQVPCPGQYEPQDAPMLAKA